jgi:hypothetical protein
MCPGCTRPRATRRLPRRRRNMRGIKSGRARQMRLPLAAARTWGGARKGAGRKPRGRPSMPHVTRPKIDPRYPVQVTIRATPGLPSLRSPRCSARSGVPLPGPRSIAFESSISRSSRITVTSRRGRRAAPDPRRHARARDPTGPGGESPARPPREGGRRSVSRPPAHDAAARRARAWSTYCSTSGSTCVRPRASTHGAPGPTFQGGSEDRTPRSSRRPRPCRPPGWRALAGGAPAGRCGSRNGRAQLRDRTPLDSADVAAATRVQWPAPESPGITKK